jgi:cytochrome b6-f complex iron-sulfur subunit
LKIIVNKKIGLFMAKRKEEIHSRDDFSRRSFLNKIWIGVGIVAFAEFVIVGISFLRPRKSKAGREKSASTIAAGNVDKFAPKTVTAFVRGRFYLSRLEDGGFLALSHKCTHLGCTLPWDENEMKFMCPCHGSAFDITGEVIDAPAPRALDIYPITIENNIVKVDTGNTIKRSEFRLEQVTYPRKKA